MASLIKEVFNSTAVVAMFSTITTPSEIFQAFYLAHKLKILVFSWRVRTKFGPSIKMCVVAMDMDLINAENKNHSRHQLKAACNNHHNLNRLQVKAPSNNHHNLKKIHIKLVDGAQRDHKNSNQAIIG